jgi:hypothetical protein
MGNLVSKVRGRGHGFDQRRPKLHGRPSFPTPRCVPTTGSSLRMLNQLTCKVHGSYSTSSTYSEDFDVASSVGWSTFQSDDFNSTTISLSVPEYYANRARGDGNHYTSLAHGAGQSRRGSSLVARGPEERAITRKPITSRSVSLASTADTARSEHLVQGRDTSTYGSERVDSRQPPGLLCLLALEKNASHVLRNCGHLHFQGCQSRPGVNTLQVRFASRV